MPVRLVDLRGFLCDKMRDIKTEISRRDREEETVGPVEHAAVTGDKIGEIFDTDHALDQRFFIPRKVDGFDSIIALGKLISVADLLGDDLGKEIFFGERRFYQFDHLLFGKTFVQRIDRLKRVFERLIVIQ